MEMNRIVLHIYLILFDFIVVRFECNYLNPFRRAFLGFLLRGYQLSQDGFL